jgi:hypothetical protein
MVDNGSEPFLPVGWFAGNENIMTTRGQGALAADIGYISPGRSKVILTPPVYFISDSP